MTAILKFPKNTLHVTLAAVVLLGAGCGQRSEDQRTALAVINGKALTVSEFDLRWSQLPEYARKKYPGREGRKQFLEELIDREVLLQEAKRRGTDQDRALLERVERFKERGILDLLMRDEVDSRVTVSPEEVKAYYDAHRESFTAPDEFKASHILVRTEAEALELRKQLERGKDFAELARTHSVDATTKSKGGDLGLIKRGQTVPEFEKTLMKLKPGEVGEPVATQFGYHLIKVSSRTPGRALSYEDAKDQAREQLLIDKKQKRFKELVAGLRSKAQVRISEDKIPAVSPGSASTGTSAAYGP
jgi:peptidyl-prolyl cis-trans isomerase C